MSPSSEERLTTLARSVLQGRFRDYMVAEVACMCEDIGEELPDDPEELNRLLMAWIEKNAQKFRDRWVREQSPATITTVN